MLDLGLRDGALKVREVSLECRHLGAGPKLLLLHGGAGPMANAPFLAALAENFEVILPAHPRFEGSAAQAHITSVDDLAYLYLDLLDEYDLQEVILLGFSMGGWLALEIATKSCERISKLVLVDTVGVKFTDRETRQFPDIYAMAQPKVAELMFHDPAKAAPDLSRMTDAQITAMVRNREALAYYAWEPYLHNPKLRHRLHRVRAPVHLIWGESDGLASPDYGRQLAAALGATFDLIREAGHAPQLEQPARFIRTLLAAIDR